MLRNFSDQKGVPSKELTFFIVAEPDPDDDFDDDIQSQSENYLRFEFELLSLKDGCSEDLKHKHYMNTLDGLMHALNETLDRGKMKQNESLEDALEDDEEEAGYSFRTKTSWEDK